MAAKRLGRKNEAGKIGVTRRGNHGLEMKTSRGNKGGKMGKNGRG
jgi:hypothetical protein